MKKRMDKKAALFLIMITCCSFIILVVSTSLWGSKKQEKSFEEFRGPLIPIQSTLGPSDAEFDTANVVNNNGMSGTNGRNQTHSSLESDMWRVTAKNNEEVFITFDFGKVVPLGEMWIWNFNANRNNEDHSSFGLKNIQIYYSTNGDEWLEWKGKGHPFRLAVGNGDEQLYPTNLDNKRNSPVQFSGLPARFIKIVAKAKPGDGNWSSSNQGDHVFGLSEVRFYRYSPSVSAGGEIIPISVHAEDENMEQNDVENIINHFGLDDKKKHGNNAKTMWQTSELPNNDVSLIFDLGGTYPLKEMKVWNYNASGDEGIGIKNITISYSLDKKNWTELKGEGYPYQLAIATGKDGLEATNLNDKQHSPINFGGVSAKFIKITPKINEGNWGAKSGDKLKYGLSAVEFIADSGLAVEHMDEWDALFSRYTEWTGADGTYSLPLNRKFEGGEGKEEQTLFLFSDTYIGNVHPVTRQRIQANMLNNSLAILQGIKPDPKKMEFIWNSNTTDVNLFTPKTDNSPKGSWYWLQDGAIVDDELYLFPLLMVYDASGDAGFEFAIDGVSMISMPLSKEGPHLEQQEQLDTPLYRELADGTGSIVFGAGILNVPQNDEQYIYVYGYKDMKSGTKDLVVSRVPREEIRQFDKWEFWDGTKWSKDILDAAVLVEGVSPELSVDYIQSGPFKDQYVLVYEKDTLSGYIAVSTTDRPEGPFSKSKIIHFVPEAEKNEKSIITYNAKAHPHLSKEGELLISYNVNTTNPSGNIADADIYRPRWIRIREIKSE